VRLVPPGDHAAVPGTDSEVVLGDLPAPGLGADRAATSGRSAIEIVERVVTVPAPAPRQTAWVDLLRQLAAQVEQGTVYDRHLAAIAAALDDVVGALHGRGRTTQPWPRG
jgi:hypothetical protein